MLSAENTSSITNVGVGNKFVFCPNRHCRVRGAVGKVISRTTAGKKGKKRVKSFLLRWLIHRKGVSDILLRGKRRKKGNRFVYESGSPAYIRRQENSEGLHPTIYCDDCPLKLSRLMGPCPVVEVPQRFAGMSVKEYAKEHYAKKVDQKSV